MISLAQPGFLLVSALLLLPYVLTRRRAWQYSSLQLFQGAKHIGLATWLVYGLSFVGISLLVLAFARPQKGTVHTRDVLEVRDILLTLDLSLSMEGFLDWQSGQVPPTKLELIQEAALKFVQQHQHDRLGLIVFGDDAFGVWPLSEDSAMLQQRLQRLHTLLPPALRGTHMAKAVEKSLDHFDEFDHTGTKILLLLTDGLDSIEPAVEARLMQRLKRSEVKLYVLGMQLDDTTSIVRLAQRVAGGYFNINNADELGKALRDIDQQETSKVTLSRRTERHDLYPFFASTSLLALFLSTFLKSTWVWEL
jgi:Ca-activated chloride channel family protein